MEREAVLPSYNPIFSNKGLRVLTTDFQKVDEVRTESAKLLLYKKI